MSSYLQLGKLEFILARPFPRENKLSPQNPTLSPTYFPFPALKTYNFYIFNSCQEEMISTGVVYTARYRYKVYIVYKCRVIPVVSWYVKSSFYELRKIAVILE